MRAMCRSTNAQTPVRIDWWQTPAPTSCHRSSSIMAAQCGFGQFISATTRAAVRRQVPAENSRSSTRRTSKSSTQWRSNQAPTALTDQPDRARRERFRIKLAGERDGAGKMKAGKRRQGGPASRIFHRNRHGQTIHHMLSGQMG